MVNVRFSTLALILVAVAARGENPAPAPAGNALDAARRDLRALPVTEKSSDGLGKLPGSADVPALTLPTSDAAPSKPDEPTATPSPTWLLDALTKTDTDRRSRQPLPDAGQPRDRTNAYKPVVGKDPLTPYLAQWMAPRDLELLRPTLTKTADGTQNSQGSTSVKAIDEFSLESRTGAMASLPQVEPAKNPYLQELEPAPAALNPFAPTGSMNALANDRDHLNPMLPAPPSAELPAKQDLRKAAATTLEPAAVSPTTPIINSGKYFPQLRRF